MALLMELEQAPTWWHLSAKGVLDEGECSTFRLSIHRILKSRPRAAIVDFSELSYIDSSGLGVLLAMSKEYRALGGRLVVVTSEPVDRILRLVKIDRVFATASSFGEAAEMIDANATLPAADADISAK